MPSFEGSLDANIVLRLLLNDVPEQHAAAHALLRSAQGQFVVADTVIIEIAFVLCGAYAFTRDQAAEAINGLLSLAEVSCNNALFEKALPLFTNHPSLSFEDCCLSIYAELDSAIPLRTFDKKLANQAPNAQLVVS